MENNALELFSGDFQQDTKSLFVVYNEVITELSSAEIFDSKRFTKFQAVSYVSSPKFFIDVIKDFQEVVFILGIDNSDNLNKFSDGVSAYFLSEERVNFFNNLPTDTKEKIISNDIRLRYGKVGTMIHDKIYLLSNDKTNDYRVIIGSANFSKSAFDTTNKNFENVRIDDSKKLFDLYLERFNYLLEQTNDYIPERCRKKYSESKTLLVVSPDTEFQLLADNVTEGNLPTFITQSQMDMISQMAVKANEEVAEIATKKLISEIVFDKKDKAGNFRLKKADEILKKKIVVSDAYRKGKQQVKDDSDIRETLIMTEDYKVYKQVEGDSDDMYLYSRKAEPSQIKATLEKINLFTQAYCDFTLTPSQEIASKIFEMILYAFTAPFIWKIRQKCAMVYDKSSVADIPIFFIMGGIRQSGKSTALRFTANLLGQRGKQIYDYSRELDGAGIVSSLIQSNNLMPVFADEVSLNFFKRSNSPRKGEDFIKGCANIIPDEPMGTFIGTTNLSEFSSSGQVIRRIYYVEVSSIFDSSLKRESLAHLKNIYDGLSDDLFRDFTHRFADAVKANEKLFTIEDFLSLARKIFLRYYEESKIKVPSYFPQKIFRDYDVRKVSTWRNLFFANRSAFIDKGDVLQVNIDEIFKNSNNAEKQKDKLMNFIDETCLISDAGISVNWFLKKKEFYRFIEYSPTMLEIAKNSIRNIIAI